MRNALVTVALAAATLAACEGGEPPPAPSSGERTTAGAKPGEAELPEGGLPPFGQRGELRREGGSWSQQLEPDPTEFCSFTERPPAERPAGLVVTAWSGNMDLLTEGYVLGQDPSAPFVEAMWMKRKPVIAARAGMPDLWIEPVGNLTNTILRIGPDELTCVRWEG